MKEDLKSSVKNLGATVTQIIHFVGGEKRTFHDIDVTKIQQGQFTKLFQTDGTMIMINDKNVLCIEVFSNNSYRNFEGNKIDTKI